MQANISVLELVNSTTGFWRFEPLPAENIAVIDGGLKNGTIINGFLYNGTAFNGTALENTTVIELVQASQYGGASLMTIIYLIMSIVVIPATIWCSWGTIKPLIRKRLQGDPVVSESTFTERDLNNGLARHYPPDPKGRLLPSHLELVHRKPGGEITSQDLRQCRELIRAKYALDVEAYSQKDVHVLNRHIVEDKKRRSKGALDDIKEIVSDWKNSQDQWEPHEWVHVEDIFRRIQLLCHPRPGPVDPIDIEELEG